MSIPTRAQLFPWYAIMMKTIHKIVSTIPSRKLGSTVTALEPTLASDMTIDTTPTAIDAPTNPIPWLTEGGRGAGATADGA